MNEKKKIRVLFCCMGNICRSPTAEGVFAHLARSEGLHDLVHIDSAGTHAYHVGNPPDPRAQASARNRGIDISGLRARKVQRQDFDEFDFILAMDEDNLAILQELCPAHHQEKLALFLSYAPHLELSEVPDPYYGGAGGFERVLDMIEEASRGLLAEVRRRGR